MTERNARSARATRRRARVPDTSDHHEAEAAALESAEDCLDEALMLTFPASDPIAVRRRPAARPAAALIEERETEAGIVPSQAVARMAELRSIVARRIAQTDGRTEDRAHLLAQRLDELRASVLHWAEECSAAGDPDTGDILEAFACDVDTQLCLIDSHLRGASAS